MYSNDSYQAAIMITLSHECLTGIVMAANATI